MWFKGLDFFFDTVWPATPQIVCLHRILRCGIV